MEALLKEVIRDFRDVSSKKNDINLELIGFDKFGFDDSDKKPV